MLKGSGCHREKGKKGSHGVMVGHSKRREEEKLKARPMSGPVTGSWQ